MYELTTGDMRTIAGATAGWRMYVNPILDSMESVPQEVTDRIQALEDAYRKDYLGFYRDEMDKDESRLEGEIQNDFEEGWTKEHPEFYDMDQLFRGCSDQDLAAAEEQLTAAKDALHPGPLNAE